MTNKERFKANIRMVELEQHSYCNRKCWFCPNQFIDRQKPVEFLDAGVYRQILNDLASIGYDQIISFSGNCEPFSQPEFLDRVKQARDLLPDAFLMTNTNTDYLTTEVVHNAAEAGLNVIRAQLYFDEDEEYTEEATDEKMWKLREKLLGIDFLKRLGSWFAIVGENMVVHAYSKDFRKVGHNRCDVRVRKTVIRMHTCFEPVQYFGVDYQGIATPCCNIRPDYEPYKDIVLGKMNESPGRMFELYQGLLLPETKYPCRTCMGKHGHPNGKLVYKKL
jgi:organic radical activating enzyme